MTNKEFNALWRDWCGTKTGDRILDKHLYRLSRLTSYRPVLFLTIVKHFIERLEKEKKN